MMRAFRPRVAVLVTAAVLLAACNGDDDQAPEPGGTEESETGGEAAPEPEPEPTEGEVPVSTIRTYPVDAPESAAEIRVAEIIVEFDGEVDDEGTLLTLEEPILFDFDADQLKSSAAGPLDDIAEVLDFYGDAPVQVIGHTDDQGSADYNQGLSQRRADAVTQALTSRGIDAGRITSEGRGFDDPVTSNDTDEGRAQNRRVEVLIVGVEPPETDG